MSEKQLYRSRHYRIFFGVAGGLGEFLGIDPLIIRLLFVLLAMFDGLGFILYLVLAIMLPKEPLPGDMATNTNSRSDFAAGFAAALLKLTTEFKKRDYSNWRKIFGAFFLAFGLYLLFISLNPHGFFGWGRELFWPILVILLGCMILMNKKQP